MSLDGLAGMTKRIWDDEVQRVRGIDAIADPLLTTLLDRAPAPRTGGIGQGAVVAVRVNDPTIQWYSGGSPISTPITEKPITGLVKWGFGRAPLALWDTDLFENAGIRAHQLADPTRPMGSFSADEQSALIDVMEDAVTDTKAGLVENVSQAVHTGGTDQDGNPDPLAPDGLDQVFDETQEYATIPVDVGQFTSQDPWVLDPRGDFGSDDVWIPTIYRSQDAPASIAYNLLIDTIYETQRWGGKRFCELSQAMYARLLEDVRTNWHITPNQTHPRFGYQSFDIGDVTFAPGLRAPTAEARIINLRTTRLRFALSSGSAPMDMGPQAEFVRLPVEMGNWAELTGVQKGVETEYLVALAVVCNNRRSCTKILNLTP